MKFKLHCYFLISRKRLKLNYKLLRQSIKIVVNNTKSVKTHLNRSPLGHKKSNEQFITSKYQCNYSITHKLFLSYPRLIKSSGIKLIDIKQTYTLY